MHKWIDRKNALLAAAYAVLLPWLSSSAIAQSDEGGVVPLPGVLGLVAIGGAAAAAVLWRNRRK